MGRCTRGDECRHLSRHGPRLLAREMDLRRLVVIARSWFHAMTSCQHAERQPASRSGTEARDLRRQALLFAIEADLEASGSSQGQGIPRRLGSASDLSRHPGCPALGLLRLQCARTI